MTRLGGYQGPSQPGKFRIRPYAPALLLIKRPVTANEGLFFPIKDRLMGDVFPK
jgi:hypothetical protein